MGPIRNKLRQAFVRSVGRSVGDLFRLRLLRKDSVVQWLSSHHLFHLKSHTLNYLSINLSFAMPFRAVPCRAVVVWLSYISTRKNCVGGGGVGGRLAAATFVWRTGGRAVISFPFFLFILRLVHTNLGKRVWTREVERREKRRGKRNERSGGCRAERNFGGLF